MNTYVETRIKGLIEILNNSYEAGNHLSSATKGNERELFIGEFLSKVYPPYIRFGTGDITDINNQLSGQVDIVVESPFLFSFPIHANGPRLYLAEGVAAALEVKSDITGQWGEVIATTSKIKKLRRRYSKKYFEDFGNLIKSGSLHSSPDDKDALKKRDEYSQAMFQGDAFPPGREDIPVYAIGFKGWKNINTMQKKLKEASLDGIIVLNPLRAVFSHEQFDNFWGILFLLEKLTHNI